MEYLDLSMNVRINTIIMNGKKRKPFSWIMGRCSQEDQGVDCESTKRRFNFRCLPIILFRISKI